MRDNAEHNDAMMVLERTEKTKVITERTLQEANACGVPDSIMYAIECYVI